VARVTEVSMRVTKFGKLQRLTRKCSFVAYYRQWDCIVSIRLNSVTLALQL